MSEFISEKNNKNYSRRWVQTSLNQLCITSSGGTPLRSKKEYYDGNIPWIKSGELKDLVIEKSEEMITKSGLDNSSAKIFPKGTILVAMYGANIGKISILGIESATNQAICAIFNDKSILDSKYLFWYLQSQRDNLIKKGIGAAQPNISQDIINKLKIPLAPANEQKRIVSKIEELFSEIEFIKKTLEKTNLRLDIYRHSFLNKILNKFHKKIPLSTIAHVNPNPEKNRFSDDLPVTFLPMRNVEEMTGKIDVSITRKFKEVKKGYTFFEEGDILFAKITPCMENGKIAIAQNLTNKIGFGSTEFHVIRFKNDDMLPRFYFWYFLQDEFRNNVQRNMKGTAGQLRVSSDYIKNVLVPYTTKVEQSKTIVEIEESISKINIEHNLIIIALKKLDHLKQTILKQAFEGKLVPQDPNDEPAEILLQKIKQEKEKSYSAQSVINTKPIKSRRRKNAK